LEETLSIQDNQDFYFKEVRKILSLLVLEITLEMLDQAACK